jgi:hypothetical protein
VNYQLRTHAAGFPPLAEIRAEMADAASQLAPQLFATYPRLAYLELHAKHGGFVVANMGLSRHAAEVLGDSTELYSRAAALATVPGLGFNADLDQPDLTFTPNQALARTGRIR